jgi:hypothetical protein
VGHELHAVSIRIGEVEAVVATLGGNSRTVEVGGCVVERKASRELECLVVEAGDNILDELERVRLVAAAEKGSTALAAALGQAELDAPARDGFVEINHAQADVVDSAKT